LKKLFSILLLLVFLFNTVGYRLAFFYLIKEADSQMELKAEQINEHDKHLVTLKIPINLPYQTDWKDFEPADGETVIKGITYKMVKRKVSRDTLILLCMENSDKTRLEKNSDDYFKKSNGLDSNTSKKTEHKQLQELYFSVSGFSFLTTNQTLYQIFRDKRSMALQNGYHRYIENPPERTG
jgi:hypothetical protein